MIDDEVVAFGTRVSSAMAAKKIDIFDTAIRSGITPKRLRRLLDGYYTYGPRLDEVRELARVLGVDRDWLGHGAKSSSPQT